MLSIPKSPIAASIFSGLDGIASIYAGPQDFMLELGGEKEIARVTADENGKYRIALLPGEITFWIATTAVAATSARRRNRSQ
jgi:hypothetical protein